MARCYKVPTSFALQLMQVGSSVLDEQHPLTDGLGQRPVGRVMVVPDHAVVTYPGSNP